MALSALEQAYLDYMQLHGGGTQDAYWGTTLTGGGIAGDSKGKGKKERGKEASEDTLPPKPGSIPVKDGKLPFDPKSYPYQHSINPDGGPHFYYNNYDMQHGRKVPCDGWVWWEYPAPGEVFKLPPCPTDQPANKKPPLVSYYDFP